MDIRPPEILGIGSPFIDIILPISEAFLRTIPGSKGGMEPVNFEFLQSIISSANVKPKVIAGGSCANTIKGLARLGHECALLGKVGKDSYGSQFLAELRSLGIIPFLIPSEIHTSLVAALVTPDGERTFRDVLGASAHMSEHDLSENYFQGVKLVHIEGYSLYNDNLALKAMQLAKKANAKISLDLASFEVVNKFKPQILHLLEKYVDIVFANKDEIYALTDLPPEQGIDRLKGFCDIAVALMGKNGCLAANETEKIHCPAFSVNTVDTTGAGDLFASGFLHGILSGYSLQESARFGTHLGAAVVQVLGAEIPHEDWQQLKILMKKEKNL